MSGESPSRVRRALGSRFLRESSAWRLHVRYEDLVTNPEDTLRKVCEFLELPFLPVLDFRVRLVFFFGDALR